MKKLPLFLLLALSGLVGRSQTTGELVYAIFQSSCNNSGCHNAADKAAGLDLEGSGLTVTDKLNDILAHTWDSLSHNPYNAGLGHRIIYPGDPYRSTLFRKVHHSLDASVNLSISEGEAMPSASQALRDEQIELIRQWILFDDGATETSVDTTRIWDYYNNGGITSQPDAPPAPPAGQGFQVHLGPFFMLPGTEEEFFWKYRTEQLIPADVEVTAVAPIFGTYSHHFILNRFETKADADGYEYGLRGSSSHFDATLVGVYQFTDTLALPEETAFQWPADSWLDFNSHHINYSPDKVMAANVYLNVYTQPLGTATQIMRSEMVPNFAIFIPADNNQYTFELPYFNPIDFSERFIWSVTSHTHKYGTSFQVYSRNLDGSKNDLIYDAEYEDGDPASMYLGYDYKHPPQRFFPAYLPIRTMEGVIFRATYVNTGTTSVSWGETSEDEMMLLIYYYLEDTTGLPPIGRPDEQAAAHSLRVFPNPAGDHVWVSTEDAGLKPSRLAIHDPQGRLVFDTELGGLSRERVHLPSLAPGAYVLTVTDSRGRRYWEKLILQ
jgi:hypothetical protein